MQQQYDVVVVGSGIGGMAAGALLSHWGYKTLVVEKLDYIGGRWSTEEYEGFKIPTGGVMIHYRGTEMAEIFREVGAEFEFIDVPRLFYRFGGKDYEMPAKGSLSVGLDIISKLEEDKVKLLGGFAKAVAKEKVMSAFRLGTKGREREGGPTFKEWLLQYTDNETVHGLFDTICSTLGAAHSYEVPASGVFKQFVVMGGIREVGLAPRGNIVHIQQLAKVIRANGDVWINCPAKRILITGKEAKGVVVERDGDEVEIISKVVISDAGPRITVRLAGGENFDEEYLRMMRLKVRPTSVTMCFVASDRPLWPEDASPAMLMIVGARRLGAAIPMSNISPELAPPGQHLMFAFGMPVSNEVHMNFEVEREQCLLDIKEQFPLFEKYGRILKFIQRDMDDDMPLMKTRVGLYMPVETPVRNLYNVGDGIQAPGCVAGTAATENAKRVAEIIRKSFKPAKA